MVLLRWPTCISCSTRGWLTHEGSIKRMWNTCLGYVWRGVVYHSPLGNRHIPLRWNADFFIYWGRNVNEPTFEHRCTGFVVILTSGVHHSVKNSSREKTSRESYVHKSRTSDWCLREKVLSSRNCLQINYHAMWRDVHLCVHNNLITHFHNRFGKGAWTRKWRIPFLFQFSKYRHSAVTLQGEKCSSAIKILCLSLEATW